MTGKFFQFEHHSGDEFILRFRLPAKGEIGRVALKEGLLIARSFLDAVAESLEQTDKEREEARKATTAKIEVE